MNEQISDFDKMIMKILENFILHFIQISKKNYLFQSLVPNAIALYEWPFKMVGKFAVYHFFFTITNLLLASKKKAKSLALSLQNIGC